MRSTEKISVNFQSARGEAAKESVQEMVSKPWQNYFDDIESPNVPVTLLEGNVKNLKVTLTTDKLSMFILQEFFFHKPGHFETKILPTDP